MLGKQEIQLIKLELSKFDPIRLGVFGSVARNEDEEHSDIDLLVHFSKPINLLDLIGVEQILTQKLKRKVEIITETALSEKIRPSVMKDLKPL